MMTFNEYQEFTATTAMDSIKNDTTYFALELCDEAGEVAGKVKKLLRDGTFDSYETAKELGDCLYPIARLADLLGYSLLEIAEMNKEKLTSRVERGVISGSGDNR